MIDVSAVAVVVVAADAIVAAHTDCFCRNLIPAAVRRRRPAAADDRPANRVNCWYWQLAGGRGAVAAGWHPMWALVASVRQRAARNLLTPFIFVFR